MAKLPGGTVGAAADGVVLMAKPPKLSATARAAATAVTIEVVERLTGQIVSQHGPYRAVLAPRLERAIAKDLDLDRYYTRLVEGEAVH